MIHVNGAGFCDDQLPVLSTIGRGPVGPQGEKGDKGDPGTPTFADPLEWDSDREYEQDTIVLHEGNSYVSIASVPVGIDISDDTYWALAANYNAQVEELRQQMLMKACVFDTVADMKASDLLYVGAICHTNGFHAVGDDGAAWYKVSDTGTANEMDVIALQDDLYANLIVLESYVTPEMFGAYGDGTNDDTVAIQRAIGIHDKIKFANTYKTTDTILVDSYRELFGNGTIVGYAPESNDVIQIKTGHHVIIKDISVISPEGYNNFNIQVFGEHNQSQPHDVVIQNVTTETSGVGGVFINSAYNVIIDCLHHSGGRRAVGIKSPISSPDRCHDITIENCISSETTNFGIQTYYGNNMIVRNNLIDGASLVGGDLSCITIDRTKDAIVSGNICSAITRNGIFVTGTENVSVVGNVVKGDGNSGIQVIQNNEYYTEDSSILECKNTVVSGNVCQKTIVITGCIGITVSANSCSDMYIANTKITADGNSVTTESSDITIVGNNVTDTILADTTAERGITDKILFIGNRRGTLSGKKDIDIVIDDADTQITASNIMLNGLTKRTNMQSTAWLRQMQYASNVGHDGFRETYSYGSLIFANDRSGESAFSFGIGQNQAIGNFKIYAKGGGVILVSPDGNVTKKIRLENDGTIGVVNV